MALVDALWDEQGERAPELAPDGEILVVGSVNNGVKSLERVRSRLLVEEHVIKKSSSQRRPNTSMASYEALGNWSAGGSGL